MSLGIAFKGAEGIVLAADSRVTLLAGVQLPGLNLPQGTSLVVPATFDNATKLISTKSQTHVAAVTFGSLAKAMVQVQKVSINVFVSTSDIPGILMTCIVSRILWALAPNRSLPLSNGKPPVPLMGV